MATNSISVRPLRHDHTERLNRGLFDVPRSELLVLATSLKLQLIDTVKIDEAANVIDGS